MNMIKGENRHAHPTGSVDENCHSPLSPYGHGPILQFMPDNNFNFSCHFEQLNQDSLIGIVPGIYITNRKSRDKLKKVAFLLLCCNS